MKKYYRSSTESYIGGVCGGLEEYTQIDAIIWRILFAFIPWPGLMIYLIMWIFTESK